MNPDQPTQAAEHAGRPPLRVPGPSYRDGDDPTEGIERIGRPGVQARAREAFARDITKTHRDAERFGHVHVNQPNPAPAPASGSEDRPAPATAVPLAGTSDNEAADPLDGIDSTEDVASPDVQSSTDPALAAEIEHTRQLRKKFEYINVNSPEARSLRERRLERRRQAKDSRPQSPQ